MINRSNHMGTNKWVLHLMAFAFFWLVCGELITLHQKAIYGFDPFSQETPFAKTDNSSSKTKLDKGWKFDKFKDQFHFDLLNKEAEKFNYVPQHFEFEHANSYTIFLSQSSYPLIASRAPPIS